jgi:chemotaxis protein methyltransferase CheR
MGVAMTAIEITDNQFAAISALVHGQCGINLHDGKKELVRARLAKRLRTLGLTCFDAYLEHLRSDRSDELVAMLDALSTNLTSFFRESDHFVYLSEKVLPRLPEKRLRLWSAGCSSGEEPYSIAIQLAETLPDLKQWDARMLATDLSTAMLAKAQTGLYTAERLDGLPEILVKRHFTRQGADYCVRSELRGLVHFARLNLMDPWPMRGPFDVIFCRNVMIYFDKPTQSRLVQRFWELLRPGGTLFIGHSESLTGVRHGFAYVQPTVYEKAPAGAGRDS